MTASAGAADAGTGTGAARFSGFVSDDGVVACCAVSGFDSATDDTGEFSTPFSFIDAQPLSASASIISRPPRRTNPKAPPATVGAIVLNSLRDLVFTVRAHKRNVRRMGNTQHLPAIRSQQVSANPSWLFIVVAHWESADGAACQRWHQPGSQAQRSVRHQSAAAPNLASRTNRVVVRLL